MAELPTASAMMAAAEQATGLSDWGDELFRRPFEVLISDLNTEAQLTDIGAERAHRRLSDTLAQRLKVVDDRKRFPGIAGVDEIDGTYQVRGVRHRLTKTGGLLTDLWFRSLAGAAAVAVGAGGLP